MTVKSDGTTWNNNTEHAASYAVSPAQIYSAFGALKIQFGGTGGVSGDNWNINAVTVTVQGGRCLYRGTGNPLVRLTGSSTVFNMSPGSGC